MLTLSLSLSVPKPKVCKATSEYAEAFSGFKGLAKPFLLI
jgi:hypothetical protein